MAAMIKTSVFYPAFPSLFYHRTSFKNASLHIPSGIHHPFSLQIRSRTVIPILNPHKATTPLTFKCGCFTGNFLAETKNDLAESYSILWNCARKWLFVTDYMLFFWAVWKHPKFAFMAVLLTLLKALPPAESSKKMEPENISLDDLVGVEDAKVVFQKILHIIHELKDKKLNMGILPGALLYGPEGTGKQTLVHALVREAKFKFFPILLDDIKNEKVGRNEIESLFRQARASTPSIVYIKDIDVISKHKGNCEIGGTLDKLCDEMEECFVDDKVMVIATTNKPEALDPNLMDWFFFKVHVDRPNEDSRRKFICLKLNKILKEEDREAICNLIASKTPGFLWGNLRKITHTCFTLANGRGDNYVSMDVVLQVLEQVLPRFYGYETKVAVNEPFQH